MRVEAPTTFMTAYQQGRDNRRQDKLDSQNLAFTVFDEGRQRELHKYKMDKGSEDVRHLKTINPIIESLKKHDEQFAWDTIKDKTAIIGNERKYLDETLNARIGRTKEDTRHAQTMNPLMEAAQAGKNELDEELHDSRVKRHRDLTNWLEKDYNLRESTTKSALTNAMDSRGQTYDIYGNLQTDSEKRFIKERTGKTNKYTLDALDAGSLNLATQTLFDIMSHYSMGDAYGAFNRLSEDERIRLGRMAVQNQFSDPLERNAMNINKERNEYDRYMESQSYYDRLLQQGDDRLTSRINSLKEVDSLIERARVLTEKGDYEEASDVYKQAKLLSEIAGGMPTMSQYMQTGGK